jgi:NADH dehydrogenase
MTRIVIVGGGYGGIEAAKTLEKAFRKRKDIEITLIDRNPYHTLMTELHEVAGGRVSPEAVKVPFAKIFAVSKVRFVRDLVTSIDTANRKVVGADGTYEYDYLVLGTGAEPTYFNLPGVAEHALPLWSYDDALEVRQHTELMFRRALDERNEERRRDLLRFVVVGAGFTGMEMAGELLEQKKRLARRYDIDEDEVSIIVLEAMGEVLPILPKPQQDKAARYYQKIGIDVRLHARVTRATESAIELHTGETIRTYTIIWTAGIQGTEFAAGLGIPSRHVRRPQPNEYLQAPDIPNLYLTGDMIWFLENDKPLPQVVETAIQTGHTAAKNIIASIEGRPLEKHRSNYHGHMVSLGSRYGVSYNKGLALSGRLALALKHLINIHYLFTIAGVNQVWTYITHEFRETEDERSIVGEHLAEKIPTYWALPLRLFAGVMWLIEGIGKIRDGWLDPGEEGLSNVWAGAIRIPGVVFPEAADAATAATQAVETATAATPAAETAATAAVEATTAATSAAGGAEVSQWGAALLDRPLGIYTWFAENILSISPTFAFIMQVLVVVAEIGIGLAFIGGFLTFPAAVVSILLGLMFIVSAMAGTEVLWYIFSAILLMGGAGRAFGLDYWVMRRLRKWWNGTRFARRTYLYVGRPTKKPEPIK